MKKSNNARSRSPKVQPLPAGRPIFPESSIVMPRADNSILKQYLRQALLPESVSTPIPPLMNVSFPVYTRIFRKIFTVSQATHPNVSTFRVALRPSLDQPLFISGPPPAFAPEEPEHGGFQSSFRGFMVSKSGLVAEEYRNQTGFFLTDTGEKIVYRLSHHLQDGRDLFGPAGALNHGSLGVQNIIIKIRSPKNDVGQRITVYYYEKKTVDDVTTYTLANSTVMYFDSTGLAQATVAANTTSDSQGLFFGFVGSKDFSDLDIDIGHGSNTTNDRWQISGSVHDLVFFSKARENLTQIGTKSIRIDNASLKITNTSNAMHKAGTVTILRTADKQILSTRNDLSSLASHISAKHFYSGEAAKGAYGIWAPENDQEMTMTPLSEFESVYDRSNTLVAEITGQPTSEDSNWAFKIEVVIIATFENPLAHFEKRLPISNRVLQDQLLNALRITPVVSCNPDHAKLFKSVLKKGLDMADGLTAHWSKYGPYYTAALEAAKLIAAL